jgi:hypothetical protein
MECSICLDVINGPTNIVVTNCGHSFHCLCLMTNIAHMRHNSLKCPNCREPLSNTYQPTVQEMTLAELDDESDTEFDEEEEEEIIHVNPPAPQLNIQFHPPALPDLPDSPLEPERVIHRNIDGINRYIDEDDYVYDINTLECIGLMYNAETFNDNMHAIADVQPLINFIIVDTFYTTPNPNVESIHNVEPIPVPVVVEKIADTEYYMDESYRLYSMNTRAFVGYANVYEGSIEYNIGHQDGVQILEHYVIVEDFNDDNDDDEIFDDNPLYVEAHPLFRYYLN